MNLIGEKSAVAMAAAVLGLFGGLITSASPAHANANESAIVEVILTQDSDGNATSGMVSFPLDYKGELPKVVPMTRAEGVGGGTWNYGSRVDARLGKVCYSEYHHPSLMHSASVKMEGLSNKTIEGPNRWAKTNVRLPYNSDHATCHAYWSTIPW